ncbi:MAG TPA: chromate resistance protein ChrB domain-containing protein [Candidatus Binatia bacterium]|nr:chromate resistance protein ChrB domain-containing protein [Candidatus Binatia bacterium]
MRQPALLLLLVGLPPTPSSLRVRIWRRLRSLGAVPLKRSAYLLPDTPERYEDFQWLAQEIQREGGDATLVRVQQIENLAPADVLRLFHEPRDVDYQQLAARYRKLLQALERKSAAAGARVQEELARLSKDHQRVRDVDFFDAPGGAEVRRLEEVIAMRTRRPETARRVETPAPALDLAALRGRRWVTRPRPHVDRIASAWLIKRFIDTTAEFVFAPPAEFPKDAIPFDAPGVELTHHGEDCTFETLVKRARLRDRRVARLAEVVHEADLRDGKFRHEEARGIDVAVRALLAASPDDHQVLAQGMALFEGLYVTTSRKG